MVVSSGFRPAKCRMDSISYRASSMAGSLRLEQLHAVNSQHGRQRVRRSSVLALGVKMDYLLLQLLPGNQLVHPFQKDLATGLALLVLVLDFGEGNLIHDGNKSYAVDDGRIIADSGYLFRVSQGYSGCETALDRVMVWRFNKNAN
jgi:hypothetical protein